MHIYDKDELEARNETLSGNLRRYSMDDHAHTYHKDDSDEARNET